MSRFKKTVLVTVAQIGLSIFYLVDGLYWSLVKRIINYWGHRGIHSITLGAFVGGTTKTRSLYREEMLLKALVLFTNLRGRSCLDLACNDGFWSLRLGDWGLAAVTGIDTGTEAIARANFLKHVYGFPNFQFKCQNIFEFLRADRPAAYDIILLLSILYHLPQETDWPAFFQALAKINTECLIIDSRWFEEDAYWHDKTSLNHAMIETPAGLIEKWRPTRKLVCDYLYSSGYAQVLEINPAAFLSDPEKAFGNGDPYTLENVSDYITGNRTLLIAYKDEAARPKPLDRLKAKYLKRDN